MIEFQMLLSKCHWGQIRFNLQIKSNLTPIIDGRDMNYLLGFFDEVIITLLMYKWNYIPLREHSESNQSPRNRPPNIYVSVRTV